MSYADPEYYQSVYGGSVLPVDQIMARLIRASDQVDSMTYNRIIDTGFDRLTPFQQDRVKKAVCAQADFTMLYGEFTDIPLQKFSAGGIAIEFAGERVNGVATSGAVKNYLDQTGLTGRRI
jgi:hypothetical protein